MLHVPSIRSFFFNEKALSHLIELSLVESTIVFSVTVYTDEQADWRRLWTCDMALAP